ncbi:putative B6 ABC transporter permease subunit 2 [Ruicaihuangia caeni]|uniref:putative B6 ABC transporter permease subunit 2 n=1 Tax=Ruicaihuangia caeni TaxID=3042517 RepID=UPI00338E726F
MTTNMQLAPSTGAPQPAPSTDAVPQPKQRGRGRAAVDVLVRTITPVVLALLAGALVLLMLGKDPLQFYGDIVYYGLAGNGWQNSMIAMAPLLLIALGLIIAFRGKLWNLGYNGQYLLGAAIVAGFGPDILVSFPLAIGIPLLAIMAIVVGAAWTIIPALLKAKYGTNEIITTLMMSFIGVSVTNILVKGPFQDASVAVPQTRELPFDGMLPYIPGTKVHIGFIIAILMVLAFHFILKRTSFGLRLDVFGASTKSAKHVGIDARKMTIVIFVLSGAMIALAAAIDIMGLWGYLRTNWNPAYGDKILPFVFLARLNPLASIPLVAFYAVLATGGTIAAQASNLSVDFLLVIVALILMFMTIIEYIGMKRDLGQSYLPQGLRQSLRLGSVGRKKQ